MRRLALIPLALLAGCSYGEYSSTTNYPDGRVRTDRVVLVRNLVDTKYVSASATLPDGASFTVGGFSQNPDAAAMAAIASGLTDLTALLKLALPALLAKPPLPRAVGVDAPATRISTQPATRPTTREAP